MHPGCTDFFGKLVSVNTWLTFGVIRYPRLRHYPFTSGFGDDYSLIYIVNCGQRRWMTFKHTIPLCIGWDLIQVRRFRPCVNFYRRLSPPPNSTISCGFPPLSMNLFAPRLSTSTCPRLGSSAWNLVAALAGISSCPLSVLISSEDPGGGNSQCHLDRIYNYRKWQRRWTPDTSFPCRCIDMDDRITSRAHSHAVILDEFSRMNADIDSDIMAASLKDQYFGDINKLQQHFDMQLRKLARRWQVQRSSFTTDCQPVLTELFAEHRSNVQDRAHWTSASLQHTARALSS